MKKSKKIVFGVLTLFSFSVFAEEVKGKIEFIGDEEGYRIVIGDEEYRLQESTRLLSRFQRKIEWDDLSVGMYVTVKVEGDQLTVLKVH